MESTLEDVQVKSEINQALLDANIGGDCIVCRNPCKTTLLCCKQFLCENCTLKWWEYKRQCPHCRKDMIDFELWNKKYKNGDKTLIDDGYIGEHNIFTRYNNTASIIRHNTRITAGDNGTIGPPMDFIRNEATDTTRSDYSFITGGGNGTIGSPMDFAEDGTNNIIAGADATPGNTVGSDTSVYWPTNSAHHLIATMELTINTPDPEIERRYNGIFRGYSAGENGYDTLLPIYSTIGGGTTTTNVYGLSGTAYSN